MSNTPPNKKTATVEIVELYNSLHAIQQKFNALQASYRRLASIWLLATFSAIGYIWTNTLPDGVNSATVIGGVFILSGIGNCLLWMVDIGVYQKLLSSVFSQGLEMEMQYEIPQIHHKMRELFDGKGASRTLALFYSLPSSIFTGLGIFLCWTQHFNFTSGEKTVAALLCTALTVLIFTIIMKSSESVNTET